MALEQDIFAALGPLVAGRVYPLVLPAGPAAPTVPAIRYQFVSDTPGADICGDGGPGLSDTRTQVDVYHTTFDAARALRLQVVMAMQALTTPTLWEGGFDDFDSDLKLYRCVLDFITYPSSPA
jgi:hypothetical protein